LCSAVCGCQCVRVSLALSLSRARSLSLALALTALALALALALSRAPSLLLLYMSAEAKVQTLTDTHTAQTITNAPPFMKYRLLLINSLSFSFSRALKHTQQHVGILFDDGVQEHVGELDLLDH